MIPPHLSQLLADATGLDSENGPLQLTVETIGSVSLPSGRIVACDATDPGQLPFARQVEAGSCPVLLTAARLPDGDEFIAAAWLRFRDGEPARWEPAHWKGQSARRHPRPAYAVDSSIGAFMSLEAAGVLAERRNLVDMVQRPFEVESPPSGVVLQVPGAGHLSFAIFSTGFGDGVYGCWWGLDPTDQPVCLLTDFHLAGFPDPADSAPAPPWWQFWRRRS